jgi:hypothetical protein
MGETLFAYRIIPLSNDIGDKLYKTLNCFKKDIEQLTAMGFERDVVVLALREADNNVEYFVSEIVPFHTIQRYFAWMGII